jgi:hypothetical protein
METEAARLVRAAAPPATVGERTMGFSPAMALVLAEMELEDADDEGGPDGGASGAGAFRALAAREAARFRLPTRSQMIEARLPSPTPPDAGGGTDGGALGAVSPRARAAAVVCARSPAGRFLAAMLDSLPWSPRRQRALEHAALHCLAQCSTAPDGACGVGAAAAVHQGTSTCHHCKGSCAPISVADCVDCATLMSVALCFG